MVRIGIDLGESRIGVAVSDELGIAAMPHTVIESRGWEQDIIRIGELAKKVGACEIVVGMPRNMDGSYGPAAQRVEDFCERLERAVKLPVVTWDERLSTVEASRLLIEADLSRRRRRQTVDKTAAAIILQGYLDWLGIED
ncbi:MAG: Holliday junction resolvase RuvX [Bacillota bacterium]|nr:Holliday junction resolvase RuvX [Bacillota bacterium]HOB42005.1 Holliday junction resolvase RuvX [Bacillota bacterium]HOL51462.1 Holliday junction resolvase RuvX [Bacillota bacterium]HOO29618.1 Holliday junction resolvase RuvX [Bacillota bacterium]HPZ12783.1 Holliday junction resolvase RuvX [Bacillota bacterium]